MMLVFGLSREIRGSDLMTMVARAFARLSARSLPSLNNILLFQGPLPMSVFHISAQEAKNR
jgi:hypothetical protein